MHVFKYSYNCVESDKVYWLNLCAKAYAAVCRLFPSIVAYEMSDMYRNSSYIKYIQVLLFNQSLHMHFIYGCAATYVSAYEYMYVSKM